MASRGESIGSRRGVLGGEKRTLAWGPSRQPGVSHDNLGSACGTQILSQPLLYYLWISDRVTNPEAVGSQAGRGWELPDEE